MVRRLTILALSLCFLLSFGFFAYAEESDIPEGYDDILDSIPEDIAKLLPESLFSDSEEDILSATKEMTSWRYITNLIFDIVGLNIPSIAKTFAYLCGILVLCAMLGSFKKSLGNTTLDSILDLICGAIVATMILELSRESMERAVLLLDQLKLFINTMAPFVCSMYAIGGNVASAVVQNYGMIVYLTLFENICIASLELVIGLCMSLTLISGFSKSVDLIPFSNAIKKSFTFFLGFIMLIFTTVISAQTLLASKADSLSAKAAKMLASQMIPVIGGSVGDSLRTAGASVEYLRSNIGIALIVILIIMILPTIISIFLYKTTFSASHALAALLGCDGEGRIMLEISSIYGYVLAILCICSIVLLFLLTLFAKCSSVLA